jgi:hypothetical protein
MCRLADKRLQPRENSAELRQSLIHTIGNLPRLLELTNLETDRRRSDGYRAGDFSHLCGDMCVFESRCARTGDSWVVDNGYLTCRVESSMQCASFFRSEMGTPQRAQLLSRGIARTLPRFSHRVAHFRSSGRYLIQKTIAGMMFGTGVVLALNCQSLIIFSPFSLATSVAVSRTSQSGVFGSN